LLRRDGSRQDRSDGVMPHTGAETERGLQQGFRNHRPLLGKSNSRLSITQYASYFDFGNSPLHQIRAMMVGTQGRRMPKMHEANSGKGTSTGDASTKSWPLRQRPGFAMRRLQEIQVARAEMHVVRDHAAAIHVGKSRRGESPRL